MSRRIGLFIDVSNLYYCLGKKHQKKVSYTKLYEYVQDLGLIVKSIAYGALNEKADNFIMALKHIGIEPKFKEPRVFGGGDRRKADWDVGITVDMIHMKDKFDTIVLCTADGDLEPAVKYLLSEGLSVIVLACGISRELRESATQSIEIPVSMLEAQQRDFHEAR